MSNAIQRLGRDECGMSRYLHPNGYVIQQERRSWSERTGRATGTSGSSPVPPLTWWEVIDHMARRRSTLDGLKPKARELTSPRSPRRTFSTLAEAREWCDHNPREGWIVASAKRKGEEA